MRSGVTPSKLFMTADAVGGVFNYALDLAAGLAGHNVETTLAMLGPPMTESQRAAAQATSGVTLIETGLPVDWLAPDADSVVEAAAAVAELAGRAKADVVQLNTPALAVASYHAPVAAVVHSCLASWWACVKGTGLPDDFLWRTELFARGLRAADIVICPSATFAHTVAALYGCAAIAVHNGRSSANIPTIRSEPAAAAFTAGRLWDEGKNVATLDAAAGLMNVPFYAAGPLRGPNGARLAVDHIKHLGVLSETELRAYLARRPIFACASLYEPFGLAVLEAAQAGCALVLSDMAAFRELWQDAAIFVPAKEPHSFAAAIARLAANPSLRRALGAAARARAQNYTIEAMAQRMLQIYSALLGVKVAPGAAAA